MPVGQPNPGNPSLRLSLWEIPGCNIASWQLKLIIRSQEMRKTKTLWRQVQLLEKNSFFLFSPQLSGWIKYKVYAKIKKNKLWYRLVDVWYFFPLKGGLSSKNLLKLLEATLRRFIGKHIQGPARHCQNWRFEGFWKQLGTTSGQHGFRINKSMSNIKDNKNWTWSYIKGGSAPSSPASATWCSWLEKEKRPGWAILKSLWSPTPAFPSYSEARVDSLLKYIGP